LVDDWAANANIMVAFADIKILDVHTEGPIRRLGAERYRTERAKN
jgi:hypothetical protein